MLIVQNILTRRFLGIATPFTDATVDSPPFHTERAAGEMESSGRLTDYVKRNRSMTPPTSAPTSAPAKCPFIFSISPKIYTPKALPTVSPVIPPMNNPPNPANSCPSGRRHASIPKPIHAAAKPTPKPDKPPANTCRGIFKALDDPRRTLSDIRTYRLNRFELRLTSVGCCIPSAVCPANPDVSTRITAPAISRLDNLTSLMNWTIPPRITESSAARCAPVRFR